MLDKPVISSLRLLRLQTASLLKATLHLPRGIIRLDANGFIRLVVEAIRKFSDGQCTRFDLRQDPSAIALAPAFWKA